MADQEGIGLGIEDVIGDKREEVLRLAEKHGAYNVRVFGSVARGEADSDSDVDFLVEWDYERMSSWGGVGLILDLETLLGRKIHLATDKALYSRIKNRILGEAVPL